MSNSRIRDVDPKQIAQARSAIYGLLARCFYRPTRELLDDVACGSSAPLLQNILNAFQVGTIEEMLAPERNGVNNGNAADSLLFESLKEEYVHLFEGPGHMQVAPYESVHRKDVPEIEMGLVMGPSTVDARRRYAEAGLTIAKDFTDLPDHIAVELEFMRYLCAKEAEAGNGDKGGKFVEAQRDFVCEHFMKWLPDFCEAVVHASNVQFYRDLAKLTRAFVDSEAVEMIEPSQSRAETSTDQGSSFCRAGRNGHAYDVKQIGG